ncbi:MAG: nitric-oxide reductase large subunit [Armatimonadetes bacterium]|nr:nitric-oxide reductase large subunit [Armatimonadota bacterium]
MNEQYQKRMLVSPLWLQVSILTFVFGFGVLGFLAAYIYAKRPPIPNKVLLSGGMVLFTDDEIMAGQHLFEKYGLMQFGTLFGHGAYLGPDFTAEYLHRAASAATDLYQRQGQPLPIARARVRNEFKHNAYDPTTNTLVYTPGQAQGFRQLYRFYQGYFGPVQSQTGLRRPTILNKKDIHELTAYFSWAAWVCSTNRPGEDYSYTNNWPGEPLVGNAPTPEAFIWSVYSLLALLGGIGLVLFVFGKYRVLGWHRYEEETPERISRFRPPEEVRLTPAQRATAWYFLVVSGLFLAQGLLGGANAHYHVEPAGFYGLNLSNWFPYNLTRMWHVQLAIFFVASAYLAMAIFLAPLIARREPKHQDKLAMGLFGAVVIVVVGSLLGEAASLKNWVGLGGPWWWIGTQGWEYLDLGRLWQALLSVGMVFWVVILVRGLRGKLPSEHPGNMPYLFLYSAISIPVFYAVGMVFGKMSSFAIVDFWRFWVVHLWVEDFLELFTTIMVAYLFVLLGVVRQTTATRVVYVDIILYSVGGVIGTMHHLYFSGAPAVHMALGAFFSAMEVIPLMLLTFEAWRFIQLGSYRQEECAMCTASGGFPHKWAVMFLIAVGFWNFLGAGIFGFLINLPIVSYYEIGTQFTANHAHAALMGVYGMLAIGFFMFVARYFIPPDRKSEMAMKTSFWSLNIGLAWMVFVNLVPTGTLQLFDSFQNGYWHARQPDFFSQTGMKVIEWLRFPGDVLFIVGGILPVVYLALRMWKQRNRYGRIEPETETEELVQIYEEG